VSCSTISKVELERIRPVNPPSLNMKINPITHKNKGWLLIFLPYKVNIQLKTLIPVGMAITIVAAVK